MKSKGIRSTADLTWVIERQSSVSLHARDDARSLQERKRLGRGVVVGFVALRP